LQQCSADIGLDGATTTPAADMTASATTTAHDEVFSEEAHSEREVSICGIDGGDGGVPARAIERRGCLTMQHGNGCDGKNKENCESKEPNW
jgi:hypothetical protein